ERLVQLEERLPGFLQGKATPASPGERIELAQLCSLKRLHRAAARFYEEAFAAQPKLADFHRYNAACAAALAGRGQGQESAGLRRRALDWLRADLEAWGRLLDRGPNQGRSAVTAANRLAAWRADASFAGVRGPEAFASLPEAERQPWRQLWDDVAGMLAR